MSSKFKTETSFLWRKVLIKKWVLNFLRHNLISGFVYLFFFLNLFLWKQPFFFFSLLDLNIKDKGSIKFQVKRLVSIEWSCKNYTHAFGIQLPFTQSSLLTAAGKNLKTLREMQVLHKPNWSTNTTKSAQYLAGVYSSPTANSLTTVNWCMFCWIC